MSRSHLMRGAKATFLFIAFLVQSSSVVRAENTPQQWATVINLAGRQRMLTQKMTKEALFVTAEVAASSSKAKLAATTSLFEKTLAGLKDGDSAVGLPPTTDPAIKGQLDKVGGMYAELKPVFATVLAGDALSTEQISTLAGQNVPLLVEMNKAVKMYEKAASGVLGGDAKSAVVINLAGKQRMLTQKMTKECLMVHLGIEADNSRESLTTTTGLFDKTLTGLVSGDASLGLPGTSDATITRQLEKVQKLWLQCKPAFDSMAATEGTLSDAELLELSEKNLTLLKEMNAAVQLFAKAAK